MAKTWKQPKGSFISNENASPFFSVQVSVLSYLPGSLSRIQIWKTLGFYLVFISLPFLSVFPIYWPFPLAGIGPLAAGLPEAAKCPLSISSHLPKYHLPSLRPSWFWRLLICSPQPLSCSKSPWSSPDAPSPKIRLPTGVLWFLGPRGPSMSLSCFQLSSHIWWVWEERWALEYQNLEYAIPSGNCFGMLYLARPPGPPENTEDEDRGWGQMKWQCSICSGAPFSQL